mmetsp:Transcript_14739/g.25662  ORF Transcript_14739/g.25662 Transcript_14739/m.25662 type:complete len:244 (+) Transcript_14739:266-997(+)
MAWIRHHGKGPTLTPSTPIRSVCQTQPQPLMAPAGLQQRASTTQKPTEHYKSDRVLFGWRFSFQRCSCLGDLPNWSGSRSGRRCCCCCCSRPHWPSGRSGRSCCCCCCHPCRGQPVPGLLFQHRTIHVRHIRGDVKLAFAACVVHVADFPKHSALGPAHVMNANHAPHDPHIAPWVTSIQLVLVIQVDGHLNGLLRAGAPLQDFLGPVHAHEAVHFPQVHHLMLCRVPQLIVCSALLPLLPGV